jgi:hypothetical protein
MHIDIPSKYRRLTGRLDRRSIYMPSRKMIRYGQVSDK